MIIILTEQDKINETRTLVSALIHKNAKKNQSNYYEITDAELGVTDGVSNVRYPGFKIDLLSGHEEWSLLATLLAELKAGNVGEIREIYTKESHSNQLTKKWPIKK